MPTPAPTPAAAPAAASATPPPTPPAAPVAAAAPAPEPDKGKDRGSRIFKLLTEESDSKLGDKKAEPAKEPEKAKEPPAATPEPAKIPEDKPIKANKKPAISKRPDPTPEAAAIPAPVAPKADTPPADEDLVDEEKQMISEAEEAEKHLPARKGLATQVKKFIKDHQKYLEKHPEIESDADAKDAYDAWLAKNRPALTPQEQDTVRENRIAERVSKPLQEKLSHHEHELFVRDSEPQIRQQQDETVRQLFGSAIPKEIDDFAKQHGNEAAQKYYVDELEMVRNVVGTAAGDFGELVRLGTVNPKNGRPLSEPAASPSDERWEQHQRIDRIIKQVNDEFKDSAKQSDLVREGKWFCTRDEWNGGFHKFPQKYWTFDNKEVAQRMLTWVPQGVQSAIQARRDDWQRRNLVRAPYQPVAVPPAAPAVPTVAAPAPSVSPSPAATTPPGTPNTPGSRMMSQLSQA